MRGETVGFGGMRGALGLVGVRAGSGLRAGALADAAARGLAAVWAGRVDRGLATSSVLARSETSALAGSSSSKSSSSEAISGKVSSSASSTSSSKPPQAAGKEGGNGPPEREKKPKEPKKWPVTIKLPETVTARCKEGGLLLFQGPLGTAKVPLRGPLVDKLKGGKLSRRERMKVGPGGGTVLLSADGRTVKLDAEAMHFARRMRGAAEWVQSGFIKSLMLTGTGFRWEVVTDQGGFEGEPPVGAGPGAPLMGSNTRPTCTLVLTVGRSHTPRYTFPLDVIAWAETQTLLHLVSPEWNSLNNTKQELIKLVGRSPYNNKGVSEVGDPPRVLRKGKKSGS